MVMKFQFCYEHFVAIIDECMKFHFCIINSFWVMTFYIKNAYKRMDRKIFILDSCSYCEICLLFPRNRSTKGDHSSVSPCLFSYFISSLYKKSRIVSFYWQMVILNANKTTDLKVDNFWNSDMYNLKFGNFNFYLDKYNLIKPVFDLKGVFHQHFE